MINGYVAGAGPVGLACARVPVAAPRSYVGDMIPERLSPRASFGCEND